MGVYAEFLLLKSVIEDMMELKDAILGRFRQISPPKLASEFERFEAAATTFPCLPTHCGKCYTNMTRFHARKASITSKLVNEMSETLFASDRLSWEGAETLKTRIIVRTLRTLCVNATVI